MSYNHFLATSPRAARMKRNAETSETVTPPKVSGPVRTTEELQHIAATRGWQVGPVSYSDIQKMSADEVSFHQRYNADNWRAAFQQQENIRHNKKHWPVHEVRRMWSGRATEEESKQARDAGATFAARCPQFDRTVENARILAEHMRLKDMDAREVSSYFIAWRELCAEGKLTPPKEESADE